MTERIDGIDATWFLGDDAIVIRYGRGRHVPELFDALGRVTVPHAAIARVRPAPASRPVPPRSGSICARGRARCWTRRRTDWARACTRTG